MRTRAGIPTIDKIQRTVARHYRVPTRTMIEPAPTHRCAHNAHEVAHPRQVAMTLAFLLTDHSQTRIGHFFGKRDRTTVHHARDAVAKRRRDDPALHQALRRLTLELIGERS